MQTPLRPLLATLCANLCAAVLALSAAGPATAAEAPAAPAAAPTAVPIPAGHFFDNPGFSRPLLSPSGGHLAVLTTGPQQRLRLAVLNLSDLSAKVVGEFPNSDVGDFRWISDERLMYTEADRKVAQGEVRYAPGLYAVNRDGTAYRQLARTMGMPFFGNGESSTLLPWHTFMLPQAGPQDGEQVYVANVLYRGVIGAIPKVELLRLNTLNGKSTDFTGPSGMHNWILDHAGAPRLAVSNSGDSTLIHYRDPASGEWRELGRYSAFTGVNQAFEPLAFGPDGMLYVAANAGGDFKALYTLDPATGKLGKEPLLRLQGYDFKGGLIFGGDKLLGVSFLADGQGVEWLDAGMKAVQQAVDARLPHTVNLLTPPARPRTPWLLVTSYSDRQPAVHMVYNTQTKLLQRLGDSHAAIKSSQMGTQEVVRYKARDGLEIPALLTLPKGRDKNLPLVVLVHGGPYARGGSWGWSPDVQFLASRGYAVLQPEFRGSLGFGTAHFRAGWKQWGLKMQDDIADGARWAIAQGYADPRRVCIAGASYGGYATLMGLVNDPGLYKCGVNWVGVTDIELLYKDKWSFQSDLPEEWKRYGMPVLIGDLEKDAAQLKTTSPLAQAARITQPLLLAYGGADRRVPLYHGTKFRDAVKATNKDVEWVEYEHEGHGWSLPQTRVDFWTRVEKFLDRHIGPQREVADTGK
ncbi:S9 family peptidase [Pseudoduganella namucuonensis]|uniref:Prolyl oligopeptidase family protein n=1 Tax=Pseudoduganella namucuonensis TaxID=1035707 RepID=A0A1I7KJV5_9BURK|nr:alpha/beta fold hydrolase [Pseudoduganella namucuonensis]SFU97725.1 Prolyl oligopeptidase family protein [Pseudoduganella namucuonensis]